MKANFTAFEKEVLFIVFTSKGMDEWQNICFPCKRPGFDLHKDPNVLGSVATLTQDFVLFVLFASFSIFQSCKK